MISNCGILLPSEIQYRLTLKSGNPTTAFFDVPFTLSRGGNQQTLVIRFATVWETTKQGLKLVQSVNTTPTVGQSAKDLLGPKR